MSNLTTRAGKGSPLTNNELDANFTNLNSDKVEIGGDLSGTSSAPNVAKIQGRAVSADAPAIGEKLVWNGTAWEPSTDPTGEPIGHEDKSSSSISFNSGTRTFTISPVAANFVVWCKGVKYTYTSAQTVVIPDTTGLHFIYFNASGVLSTQMSYFTWEEHAPTAYVYWNSTTQQAVYFGDERHGITLDWQTHEYLHRTRGAAIASGFGASGYTTTGAGATDADAQIDIGGGTFFDEDLQVDIVSTNTPVAGTWQQDLSGPARIPVLYLSGSAWVIDAPTDFPFKVVSGVPQYNLYSGGTWSAAPVANNGYFVSWILATHNLTYPVIAVISQAATNQVSEAEAMTFEGLTLSGFPSVEFRPLYKVIYQHKTSFANNIKASTIAVYDLRSISAAGVAAALVQDHGNLSGLGDDDHAQYLHVSAVRSPSAAVTNSFLPSQASQSGKYLTTDGSNPSWGSIPSGSLTFTGDVTGTGTTGSSTTLTLSNSGAAAGTYTKVTVDAKGRVTTGALIDSSDVTTALGFTPENSANKAVANGYASLDGSGKVPSTQLPSYVDDVIEYANLAAFPETGESGKIYIAIDTAKTYRWSGSAYVEISASPGSTDAVTEGSTNLYFTNARARGAITATGSLSYNNQTGVLSYTQPTLVSTFTNDSNYLTGITGTQVTNALGYIPPQPNGTGATGTWSISISGNAATVSSITSAQVTTALGYTPYNATNPAGYTTNVGTVTSVSGTGTVSGLTLTGSVTSSGSLTLGGTLSLTSGQVTSALGFTPYNATNPSGYITSSALSSYLPLSGGTLSGAVSAPNFHDANGLYNVNLGGINGRGAAAGYSGGAYGGVGYNVRHTATAEQYVAPTGDTVSYLRFDSGGFRFFSATAGAAGRTVTLSGSGNAFLDASGNWYAAGQMYATGSQHLVLNTGNYSSYALPLSGGTLTGNLVSSGTARFSGATIAPYNGVYGTEAVGATSGNKLIYLYNNGTVLKLDAYDFGTSTPLNIKICENGGIVTLNTGANVNGSTILHAGNYSSGYFKTINGSSIIGTGDLTVSGTDSTKLPLAGGTLTGVVNAVDFRSQGQIRATGWYNTSSGTHTGLGTEIGVSSGKSFILSYNRDNGSYGTLQVNAANIELVPISGDVIVNQTGISYSSCDNTALVGSFTTNRLHVNGSIQLTGNNDAIVFGRGTASFLKDEELGFGWGGGWFMTDSTYLRVRNNKTIYSGGSAEFVGAITQNGNQVLHAGNYSSYALPLSGGTLTGEFVAPNISIGGQGRSARSAFGGNIGATAGSWNNAQLELKNTDAGTVALAFHRAGYTSDTFEVRDGSGMRLNGNFLLHAGNYSSYALPLSGGTISGAIRASQITAGGSTNTDANLGVQGSAHITGTIYYGGTVGNINSWSSISTSSSGTHTFSGSRFIFDRYGYGSQPLIDMQSGSITLSQPTYATNGITVNDAAANGRGINLYSGSPTSPTYGLFFAQTGNFGTYGAVSADWATYFTMNSTAHRGWIFREHESLGNVAAISNQGNMTLRSHFEQGNNIARPNVSWSASSTSTGMVIFYLPGTTGNYGMVHMVFDIYEYNSNAVSTVIVGGHNWSTSWYNVGANVIGQCGKEVRLGVKNGRFCVVFGTAGSSWEYGTIVLRKIHNGSFYDNIMNMVGDWESTQTTTESFTNITGDLRALRTPASFNAGGAITQAGNQVLHAGNYTNYFTYNTWDEWLRENGDNGQFKIYGNSRTLIFRTDGSDNPHGGGGYSSIWYHGGSADGNRRMILDTSGGLWTNSYGWLHDYFLQKSGSALSGTTSFNGTMLFPSGGGGVTFGSNHYSMGKDVANGSWTHPHYADLIIGYHTGIRIGAAYSGIRFYNNSPTTDANNDGNGDQGEALLMTIGGHAAGSGVIVNNSLTAYGSVSANDVYTTGGWFRNHTNNNGIYWSATGWHLYPASAGDFYVRSGTSSGSLLFLNSGGSGLGYLHCASDSAMGFLTSGGSWRFRVDNSGNARCYNNLYLDQNYGHGIVGVYASTRYQGVFAMGDSYKLPADGTSAGNLYGLAWSYPSAGGVAGNLDSHGLLVLINGGLGSAISYSIVAAGNVTAYSDERLKTNWREMPENYVERLAQVKVGIYDRIDGEKITQVGIGAQSFQRLLPEAITKAADEMGTLSVSYGNAAMASAVELAKELVMLKKELAEIKSRLH